MMPPEIREKMERLAEELSRDAFPMSFHENERKSAKWISTTSFIAAYELMSEKMQIQGEIVAHYIDQVASLETALKKVSSLAECVVPEENGEFLSEIDDVCNEALGSKGDDGE